MSMAFETAAWAQQTTPFCTGQQCRQTRELLKNLCDYIVQNKATVSKIFIGGYYMRTLVAGYEIFGDKRYLDTAVKYADYLLAHQMPTGFWKTGYGPVYLADTGSALGLMVALYQHVDPERQRAYLRAVERFTTSIQQDGMIHPWGALGTGWRATKGDALEDPIYDQYTLSSALTGAEIFTWMYHITGRDEYREVSYHALKWVFSTMRTDGNIPYILAEQGRDWQRRDDPKVADALWNTYTYGTAAYVGEGILSFDLYCGNSSWQKWIEKAVKPNIEFLLRNQLPDGTWSTSGQGSWDRSRSVGIVDYLIWYYEHVDRDPRVAYSMARWDAYVLKPEHAKAYGLLNAGADPGPDPRLESGADPGPENHAYSFNITTALTGRALADILLPGVDARW